MSHLGREHLNAVCLSAKNHVLKHTIVDAGLINSATARIGEVFKEVLKQNATAIHHCPQPPLRRPRLSSNDAGVTGKSVEADKFLGTSTVVMPLAAAIVGTSTLGAVPVHVEQN